MASLRLFTSNRLEVLAQRLCEVLKTPLASPLAPEIVVVQSRGMERWLSMQLAERHGICANVRFPFPNAFVYQTFRKVLEGLPERSLYDPDIMAWRIMGRLPSLITRPGFEDLRTYLGDTRQGLKLYQLSIRIADTFDQYLLFRPEMIFRWERRQERHWQAVLWRDLVKGMEEKHRAALAKLFFETAQGSSLRPKTLPERIS
ncbi:MAG: exodeoxyribonuclease V subunit gamma, partial [Pseudomonadota bacterium]